MPTSSITTTPSSNGSVSSKRKEPSLHSQISCLLSNNYCSLLSNSNRNTDNQPKSSKVIKYIWPQSNSCRSIPFWWSMQGIKKKDWHWEMINRVTGLSWERRGLLARWWRSNLLNTSKILYKAAEDTRTVGPTVRCLRKGRRQTKTSLTSFSSSLRW